MLIPSALALVDLHNTNQNDACERCGASLSEFHPEDESERRNAFVLGKLAHVCIDCFWVLADGYD